MTIEIGKSSGGIKFTWYRLLKSCEQTFIKRKYKAQRHTSSIQAAFCSVLWVIFTNYQGGTGKSPHHVNGKY